MSQDVFYNMENACTKTVKEAFRWADKNGLRTDVTMLDINKGWGRIPSDKDFNTVVDLIGEVAVKFFRVILRREMNLYGILTDEGVIDDVLEIAIRSIDVDSKEYFISILLDRAFLGELKIKYELECISGGTTFPTS